MNTATDLKPSTSDSGRTLRNIGHAVLRYGLVAILVWVGLLKFTAYEAKGIEPLVSHSPLMSWGYKVMSVRAFAGLIGATEIVFGLLIASRSFSARLSALGSLGAVLMFLVTLSFVLSTPGVWQEGYGFPFPSPAVGQFLLKDLLLLGAAIWSCGEAFSSIPRATGRVVPISATASGVGSSMTGR